MSSLLESIEGLDNTIHELQKIDSKMRAGRWIDAHRELGRVTAELQRNKRAILAQHTAKNEE
jgi:hypothetical protein